MLQTFAIGDIHGCLSELNSLLEIIQTLSPGGQIVFLGDYVDRGPDSAGVIRRLMAGPNNDRWNWVMLRGNHEQLMLESQSDRKAKSFWLANGGEQTMESFSHVIPDEVLTWISTLPLLHVDAHRLFVHAGVDRGVSLARQSAETLLWKRPTPDDDQGDFWGRHLCHGHTPRPGNPVTTGHRSNIDSGCVFGDSLTAAVFDTEIPGPPVRFLKVENRSFR